MYNGFKIVVASTVKLDLRTNFDMETNVNNTTKPQLNKPVVKSSVTTWTDQNKQIPEVIKTDWGYASRYVLVKFDECEIVRARLEGGKEDNLFWYSQLFDDQISDVTEWMDIPK